MKVRDIFGSKSTIVAAKLYKEELRVLLEKTKTINKKKINIISKFIVPNWRIGVLEGTILNKRQAILMKIR